MAKNLPREIEEYYKLPPRPEPVDWAEFFEAVKDGTVEATRYGSEAKRKMAAANHAHRRKGYGATSRPRKFTRERSPGDVVHPVERSFNDDAKKDYVADDKRPYEVGRLGSSQEATEKQLAYIKSLARDRETAIANDGLAYSLEQVLTDGQKISKREASRLIETLKEAPAVSKRPASAGHEKVPAGRYAVEHEGQVRFFKIDKPTEGRWEGYTFLNEVAGSERWPVKGERRREIMDLIAADPKAAAERYGIEIGACGICGRTLTDPDSIERGIGPVCAAKHGW